MTDYIEFSAKNTAEALSQAEKHFALPLSRLEVDILSTGSGGILGMFGKKARIRVRPLSAASVKDEVAQILNNDRFSSPARAAEPAAPPQSGAGKAAEENKRAASSERADDPAEPLVPLEALEQLPEQAREVVARLCQPLAGDVRLSVQYGANQLTVTINCPEPGALIGRRAQILDALQYLAGRIISHRFGRSIALVLDVEGYRSRQQKQLEETAQKLAAKALSQNRPYSLGPLSSPERKLVHSILKDKPLQTYSKGQGDLKRVIIAPLSEKR